MHIRNATPKDLPTLLSIEKRVALTEASAFCTPEMLEAWAASRLEPFAVELTSGNIFVSEDERSRVIGFCYFNPASGHIEAISVDVDDQYQGHGRALVREALIRARKLGITSISKNSPAGTREFFSHLDFDFGSSTQFIAPDGTSMELALMSRPVELPFIVNTVAALEESVRFFSPGRENQRAKERFVTEGFLRSLGLKFESADVLTPDPDPPDTTFEDARFEIKELYEEGRKRHGEYKKALTDARTAVFTSDLLQHFDPTDIPLETVVARVKAMAATYALTDTLNRRTNLDLLVYANLTRHWDITGDVIGDTSDISALGWRSVSFFRGSSTSCVLTAKDNAPSFLRYAVGKLYREGTVTINASMELR